MTRPLAPAALDGSDPDGYLIEVGQTTNPERDWTPPGWLLDTPAEESA